MVLMMQITRTVQMLSLEIVRSMLVFHVVVVIVCRVHTLVMNGIMVLRTAWTLRRRIPNSKVSLGESTLQVLRGALSSLVFTETLI